ncbi:hypothetical protein EIN_282410 [Entamoeba invadens IP1]|uniref:Uncharacterized protein n=1 Tax=Entamoeba invadens IP1 TaxID=370355 RepID=A0A0A1TX37_ENTIV|nr:hypothetical protein EIN_282410 [Entamoeba invadens IP1]ELP85860.1 hypothetical protein EIN_282410 [Entamoeba invadens IP1]|eukprot:XP_004185206.1 hypothetical protein EIN_282410 [Entamoeba invadens IP1]
MSNTVSCYGASYYRFDLNQNITELKMTALEEEKHYVCMKTRNYNAMNNCYLVEVTKYGLTCLMCDNKSRLVNGTCLPLDENCETYNKNNKGVLCKTGFVLNEQFECISSEICLYGTSTNCYKCQYSYIKNENKCVLDFKCQHSDGSVSINCHNGNSYDKCESCTSHCRLCKNEKCFICDNNFILNNENSCVEIEGAVSNGISTVWCNDNYYMANGVCNNCSSNYVHSISCDKNNAITCETNCFITNERQCTSLICINETFNEENEMCVLAKEECVFIVNNKCLECDNNYNLNNNICVSVIKNTTSTKCIMYNKYSCITCDIGYYFLFAKCYHVLKIAQVVLKVIQNVCHVNMGFVWMRITRVYQAPSCWGNATKYHKLVVGVINAKMGITELGWIVLNVFLNAQHATQKTSV